MVLCLCSSSSPADLGFPWFAIILHPPLYFPQYFPHSAMQWIPSSCPCRMLPCCVCWLAGCSSCPAVVWGMDTWTEYALNAFYFSIGGTGTAASACVFQKLGRVPVAWCTRWRSLARLRRKKQQCQRAKKLRLKLEDWTSCQQKPPSLLYPVLSLPPTSSQPNFSLTILLSLQKNYSSSVQVRETVWLRLLNGIHHIWKVMLGFWPRAGDWLFTLP